MDARGVAIVGTFLLVVAGLAFLPVAWAAMRRVAYRSLATTWPDRPHCCSWPWCSSLPALFGALAGADLFGNEKNPSVDLVRFIPQSASPWFCPPRPLGRRIPGRRFVCRSKGFGRA